MRLDVGQQPAAGMWAVATGSWERYSSSFYKNDPFVKHWHHDAEGNRLCIMLNKSNPFLDSFRQRVLHAPVVAAIPCEVPPMSPQWEGGSELNFDNNSEDGTDREVDGRYDETDGAAEEGPKDYISDVRQDHCGPRFVTALLRQLFWSCVRLGQSGTMRNCMENLQNYGSSS